MKNEAIRVLIADDHPIVRQGLELVIASQPDLDLVGQADNGAQAVELTKKTNWLSFSQTAAVWCKLVVVRSLKVIFNLIGTGKSPILLIVILW